MFKVNKNNSIIAGVCGGISDYVGIDVIIIRILMAVLCVAFPIATCLGYVLLAWFGSKN